MLLSKLEMEKPSLLLVVSQMQGKGESNEQPHSCHLCHSDQLYR